MEQDGHEYALAVKGPQISGTIQTSVVYRFGKGAQTWRDLGDHETIVDGYGYCVDPLPFPPPRISVENIDGGTTNTKIGNAGGPEGLWLADQIVESVRHGPRHWIAHLDLKPTNILLRETPG